MPDYRVAVRFDRRTQKHHATSDDIPGLDIADMSVERLFTKVAQAAPDLLRAAGKGGGGDWDFNLKFEKVEG
ncbi:MAG: DUF1902 domain-containing protein [Alphaproteobacteria bacterium]|nr:DUF1902 domain-containing protein [Alphaproteobacteria bacterium]